MKEEKIKEAIVKEERIEVEDKIKGIEKAMRSNDTLIRNYERYIRRRLIEEYGAYEEDLKGSLDT